MLGIMSSKLFLQKALENINLKSYISIVFLAELFAIYLSYKNLFNYEGCTNVVFRDFILFNQFFTAEYPEMCDESFYFHGFQWINHIYENGYVYQDRPLYLGIGFLVYRFFYIISLIFGLIIDPVSLLLFSTLVFQILIVNLTAFIICKALQNRFNRFYFLIIFLFVMFSFEQRLYFFLPSNSTTYLLIFSFSIYSIKNQKLNGLAYGIFFSISAYAVIGFLYQILYEFFILRKNFKNITKNILLFSIPYLIFELIRIFLGIFQGKQYGVKYIHAAEAVEYQQFVWFIKTLFDKSYIPYQNCHTLSQFFKCYLEATNSYVSLSRFYILMCLLFFIFFCIKKWDIKNKILFHIFGFSIFNYLFISLQGFYAYRFVYYSIGFGIILLTCLFVVKIDSDFISIISVVTTSVYTLSRYSFDDYNLSFSIFEIILITMLFIFLFIDVKKNRIN